MGSLERRLAALESRQVKAKRNLPREALSRLSDEDLEALEEVLENALEGGVGEATFEDLYAASSERSRRALEAYFDAFQTAREGKAVLVPPSRDPPQDLSGEECRNGYRIWKYKQQTKGT